LEVKLNFTSYKTQQLIEFKDNFLDVIRSPNFSDDVSETGLCLHPEVKMNLLWAQSIELSPGPKTEYSLQNVVSNKIRTMDNVQKTDHFLTYHCHELSDLISYLLTPLYSVVCQIATTSRISKWSPGPYRNVERCVLSCICHQLSDKQIQQVTEWLTNSLNDWMVLGLPSGLKSSSAYQEIIYFYGGGKFINVIVTFMYNGK
jgi:hypothetical protein